jgi:hypothetical protein
MATPGDQVKSSLTADEKIDANGKAPEAKILNSLPPEVHIQIAEKSGKTDEVLVRVERYFRSTSNVESFLAPLQYAASLISYLQEGIHPRSASTAAALNVVVGSWRNTLRLLQIPVLYTVLRQLLLQAPSARGDPLVWQINVAQCVIYLIYQLLENVAHLIDLGVLSSTTVPISIYRNQTMLYLHSNRFWLLGVSCDLLRLAREAQLKRSMRRVSSTGKHADSKLSAEQEKADTTRWWNELQTAGCTWPLCLHWSLVSGLCSFNDGVIGGLGLLASYQTLRQRWKETKAG